MFGLHLGIQGAAIATVLSQILSAVFVFTFLHGKAELKVRLLRKDELAESLPLAANIISLGTAGFIMQLTNSLVSISCNHVLSVTGGDLYISIMTIISSVRQLVETPIHAMSEGASPVLSYNYGARRACPGTEVHPGGGDAGAAVHGTDVECDPAGAGGADPYFQLRCHAGQPCGPAAEFVFRGVCVHGSAVHRTDGVQIIK